jgi:hypothetical protein
VTIRAKPFCRVFLGFFFMANVGLENFETYRRYTM